MTLCPPGAWPPESTTPTRTAFLQAAELAPFTKVISGSPYVLGKIRLTAAWSAMLLVALPAFGLTEAGPFLRMLGSTGWNWQRCR